MILILLKLRKKLSVPLTRYYGNETVNFLERIGTIAINLAQIVKEGCRFSLLREVVGSAG